MKEHYVLHMNLFMSCNSHKHHALSFVETVNTMYMNAYMNYKNKDYEANTYSKIDVHKFAIIAQVRILTD